MNVTQSENGWLASSRPSSQRHRVAEKVRPFVLSHQRIRSFTTTRYINRLFTYYLLAYLLTLNHLTDRKIRNISWPDKPPTSLVWVDQQRCGRSRPPALLGCWAIRPVPDQYALATDERTNKWKTGHGHRVTTSPALRRWELNKQRSQFYWFQLTQRSCKLTYAFWRHHESFLLVSIFGPSCRQRHKAVT